jgi:hypothetical protein
MLVEITEDEFDAQFQPTTWDYGPQNEIPAGTDSACVWTCVDDGEGGQMILFGIARVNAWGYWVCQIPVPVGEAYVVHVNDDAID